MSPEQIAISDQTDVFESAEVVVHRWHASAPTGRYDRSAVRGEPLLVQPVCVKR